MITESIKDFMTCKLGGSTRKPDYNPPDDATVQNAFVKVEGIKEQDPHTYIGSLIYQQNPVASMRFLRHKSIKQTEVAYVRYRTEAKPVNVL